MNGRPSIYHAGPIAGLTFESAAERRVQFAKALHPDIEVISPLRWKKFLADKGVLDRESLNEHPITRDAGIVARDMFDVRRATLLLADFEFPAVIEVRQWTKLRAWYDTTLELASGGTFAEVGAAHALNKPIVSILKPGGVHDHPFIRGMSGWIVASLDEAIDVVRAVLLPDWEDEEFLEPGKYEAARATWDRMR